MPDSPHYLIARGDRFAAVNALKFLRGGSKNEDILKEIDDIKASVEESMSHKSNFFHMFKGKANVLGEFFSHFSKFQ